MRIFIACADKSLRIAMLLFLDYEPGIVVVGITDGLPGLIPQLEATQPDALVLEWDLSFQAMAVLMSDIHKLEHAPKIIYLSGHPEQEENLLAAGANYVIVKNAPPDQLLPILNSIREQSLPAVRKGDVNNLPLPR